LSMAVSEGLPRRIKVWMSPQAKRMKCCLILDTEIIRELSKTRAVLSMVFIDPAASSYFFDAMRIFVLIDKSIMALRAWSRDFKAVGREYCRPVS